MTYLDDSLLQPLNKAKLFTVIDEYHLLLRKRSHVISEKGNQSVAKRVKDLQNLKNPEKKM